jgi:hypothetical protein
MTAKPRFPRIFFEIPLTLPEVAHRTDADF